MIDTGFRIFPDLRQRARDRSSRPARLGERDGKAPRSALDAAEHQSLLSTLLKDDLLQLSQRTPLVMLVDDAHRIDAESLALFASMLEPVSTHAILMVLSTQTGQTARHADAHWDYYHHLVLGDGDSAEAHRKFYDEYNAVLDMPAEYYLDTVKTVFKDFALPKGRMSVRGELVRPQAIRETALLTIEGELDAISGHGQTEAAHALCLNIPAASRAHFEAPRVGHYGIFSGRRWREVVYPRVREFIRDHSS